MLERDVELAFVRAVKGSILAYFAYKTYEIAMTSEKLLVQPALTLLRGDHHEHRKQALHRLDTWLDSPKAVRELVDNHGPYLLVRALQGARDDDAALAALSLMGKVAQIDDGRRELLRLGVLGAAPTLCTQYASDCETCHAIVKELVSNLSTAADCATPDGGDAAASTAAPQGVPAR